MKWQAGLVLAAMAMAAYLGRQDWALWQKLRTLAPAQGRPQACAELLKQRPLLLLALGQSNAGNHGALAERRVEIDVFAAGQCLRTQDPLPGATGQGGSVWSQLAPRLQARIGRPVLIVPLAVEATTLADWTRPSSPLRWRLRRLLKELQAQGLKPDLVLWQQGEADARDGSSAAAYAAGLERLNEQLATPMLLARSTVCRGAPDQALRAAIAHALADSSRFLPGPDSDLLAPAAARPDGCHFSAANAQVVAEAWAEAVSSALAK